MTRLAVPDPARPVAIKRVSGNLTSVSNTSDTTTYAWTGANRLASISSSSTSATFTYDAEGKRTSKKVNGVTTKFVYDDIKLIAEKDASGTVTATYFYDDAGKLISMKRGGNNYYFHLNHRGDVIKITNSAQSVVASYSYDPWGNILSSTGSFANDQPFRYASYFWDKETGMYYLINRYYDPVIGRFISKDPVSDPEDSELDPQEANPYTYAANNPVMETDPDGLNPMLKPGVTDATYVPLAKGMLANIAAKYAAMIDNVASAYYGDGFRNAVNAFKAANNLAADGQVGNAVWQLLYSGNSQAPANAAQTGGTGGGSPADAFKVIDGMISLAIKTELSMVPGKEQFAFPHNGNATPYLKTVLRTNANYAYAHTTLELMNSFAGYAGTSAKLAWLYGMVKSWGPWDLKRVAPDKYGPHNQSEKFLQFHRKRISPDDFGNIHYGYVGHAVGIGVEILCSASSFANKFLGQDSGGKNDDAEKVDQKWVRRGYRLYTRWGMRQLILPPQTHVYLRSI